MLKFELLPLGMHWAFKWNKSETTKHFKVKTSSVCLHSKLNLKKCEWRNSVNELEQACQTQIQSGPKFKTEQSRGPRLNKLTQNRGTQISFALNIEQARLI